MTTWTEANRLAHLAAAQAHGDLGVNTAAPPIDIYSAIGEADVVLMWRPMPRQFGAYISEPGSRPGILINNGLSHAAQRHTAAHELGHHRLGHRSRADDNLDPPETRWSGWSDEEKIAEAFAAWFLMPRKATLAALSRLGLERPRSPEDVYRLALLLGTSYRSAVRHLPNLRLTGRDRARLWATVPPNKIKAKLDQTTLPPLSRSPDVWLIDKNFAETRLIVHLGDRLVITIPDGAIARVAPPEALQFIPVAPNSSSLQDAPTHTLVRQPDRPQVPLVVEVEKISDSRVEIFASAVDPVSVWGFDVHVEGGYSGLARRWIK